MKNWNYSEPIDEQHLMMLLIIDKSYGMTNKDLERKYNLSVYKVQRLMRDARRFFLKMYVLYKNKQLGKIEDEISEISENFLRKEKV